MDSMKFRGMQNSFSNFASNMAFMESLVEQDIFPGVCDEDFTALNVKELDLPFWMYLSFTLSRYFYSYLLYFHIYINYPFLII